MRPTSRRVAIHAALVTAGLTATIAQLVLMREFVAVFYGTELVLGLILAVWLAWVAVGAWGCSRLGPPSRPPRGSEATGGRPDLPPARRGGSRGGLLAITLLTSAILLPTQIILVRTARSLLGTTPGALVPFGSMVLAIGLVLAPLCLLLGAAFTLGVRLLAQDDPNSGGIGSAYVAESAGAVLGGALFSLLLVRWLNPFQVALLVGALNLAVAGLLLSHSGAKRIAGRALALGAVALALLALPLGGWLHAGTLAWQYPNLRFARDSIYGRIVVTGSGAQRVFYENGILFFETQGEAAEEVAHLPLLAHPEPRRVLLIGGGVSGTLVEILRHPPVEAVHYVELDPLVIEAARAELPAGQAAVLDDGRVTLAHIDGRLYVREMQGQEPFDVVILDLPEPATGQLNRFYSGEFFAEVGAVLNEGGILSLGLPWQENYPGPALQRLGASIYGTLDAEFPDPLPLPGARLWLLASDTPPPADPAIYRQRLAERDLETRWVIPSYVDYLLGTDRVAGARDLLRSAPGTRPNRDLEPVSTYYALSVWLSRFSGAWSALANRATILRLGWLALALAAGTLAARYAAARLGQAGTRRLRVPLAVALAGLAAMTLQVVILLAFQVVHGYVYSQVGLLVTAFMGGLALSSGLANRLAGPPSVPPARRGGGRASSLQDRSHEGDEEETSSSPPWLGSHRGDRGGASSPRLAFILILATTSLYSLGLSLLAGAHLPAWAFPLLALIGGGLTGLVFPTAVACLRAQHKEPGRVAARLYGADLAGACLGAVLASVLLVPVLGIPQTCLAMAMVALAGAVILA